MLAKRARKVWAGGAGRFGKRVGGRQASLPSAFTSGRPSSSRRFSRIRAGGPRAVPQLPLKMRRKTRVMSR